MRVNLKRVSDLHLLQGKISAESTGVGRREESVEKFEKYGREKKQKLSKQYYIIKKNVRCPTVIQLLFLHVKYIIFAVSMKESYYTV